MSPSVRVDEDVYRALQKRAEPFVDTPNSVLRRLLGLDQSSVAKQGAEAVQARQAGSRLRQRRAGTNVRRARRSKSRSGSRAQSAPPRIPAGVLLPLEAYKPLIVSELRSKGGEAQARQVIDAVGQLVRERLSPADLEKTKSGEVRWINRVQFARHRLIEEGVLAKQSPRGVWALTENHV